MLSAELRSRTAQLHQRTEAAFDLRAACASTAHYTALLRTMLSLYRPLERRLESIDWRAAGIDWQARKKTHWLEQDLRAMNDAGDVAWNASVERIPLQSTAAGLGCLYVLEGSTLGAQFILKHIERTLGLTPSTGAAFFAGYGPATREQWVAFTSAADAYAGTDSARIDQAVTSAGATFECFEEAFATTRGRSAGAAT